MGNPFGYGSYYSGSQGFQTQAPSMPTSYGTKDVQTGWEKSPSQPPPGTPGGPQAGQIGNLFGGTPAPDFRRPPLPPPSQAPGQTPSPFGSGVNPLSQGGGYFGLQDKPKDVLGKMDLNPLLGNVGYGGYGWANQNHGAPNSAMFLDPTKMQQQVQGLGNNNFAGGANTLQTLWDQMAAYKQQYAPGEYERIAQKYSSVTNPTPVEKPTGALSPMDNAIQQALYEKYLSQVSNVPTGQRQVQQHSDTYGNMVNQQQDYLQSAYNDLVNRFYKQGAFGLMS